MWGSDRFVYSVSGSILSPISAILVTLYTCFLAAINYPTPSCVGDGVTLYI